MYQFTSGNKRNYYGKGDVIVYRLNRDGQTPPGKSPVFGANVLMLLYGDAFWQTYETGDFTVGKSADLVRVQPVAGTPLAGAMEHADSPERLLAAIITQAGAESIQEVRVRGRAIPR